MNSEPTSPDEAGELQTLRRRVAELAGACERLQRTVDPLRESEQRYRRCIEQSPYGIFFVDRSGRYREVNEAACKLTGYSRDELLGMSVSQLLAPEDCQAGTAADCNDSVGWTDSPASAGTSLRRNGPSKN